MSEHEKAKPKNVYSLQYYLSLTVFFLSSLLLLVYLNFYFFLGFGDDRLDALDHLKKSMVELASVDRSLNEDITKVEFDLDPSAFDDIPYYLNEISRLQATLESFDGMGIPAPAKREIKEYLSATQKKKEAVAEYKMIMEAYRYSREVFYISRNKINQQINDESLANSYRVQMILDSVQRQVNLFLQYPDSNRRHNNIEFLKVSEEKLKKLAPDLTAFVEVFLEEGISLIENKIKRRQSVEKILFHTGSYLDVTALDFSLVDHKKDSNILVLLGLTLLSFLTGFLFFQCIRKNPKVYITAPRDEYDIEFMEGFKELMGEDDTFDDSGLAKGGSRGKIYKFNTP